jgi:glyoxylase-like metal-dependent hydrolase (beta-lactamase superfamily II)
MSEHRLYLRQLLAGDDIAATNDVAAQMRNFVYLIGDRGAGEAVVVDPAWDIQGILDVAAGDDLTIVGALATHHHRDHVGGHMGGQDVEGLVELGRRLDVPVHVQRDEAEWVRRSSGVQGSQLVAHEPGDTLTVGAIDIELLHTPGHTPGSQCFLVEQRYLVSGDTLFLDGCGRTDLPGGDAEALYRSLHQVLAAVPDDAYVLPGHLYSPEAAAPMSAVRGRNVVYRATSPEQFLAMFGAS